MFPKAILAFLAIGALSANALSIPVARSPAPEPESQELEARMLLFSRRLQALDELFSREPQDRARNRCMAKRELFPVLEARRGGGGGDANGCPSFVEPRPQKPHESIGEIANPPKPKGKRELFSVLEARRGGGGADANGSPSFVEPRPQKPHESIGEVANPPKGKGKRELLD